MRTSQVVDHGHMRRFWSTADMPQPLNPGANTNLIWWFDAASGIYTTDARTTAAIADGDPVGSWTDLKAGRHANQNNTSYRPTLQHIGVLPVVQAQAASTQFLRGNGNLGIVGDAPWTIIVSVKFLTTTMYGTIVGFGQENSGSSQMLIQSYNDTTLFMNRNGFNYSVAPGGLDFSDGLHVISLVYDGSSQKTYVDGTLADTTEMFHGLANSPVRLFSGVGVFSEDKQFGDNQIAETFGFDAALNDSDRLSYEAYLLNKIG